MTTDDNLYEIDEINGEGSLKYFFLSRGEHDVIKAIAYDYVQQLRDSQLFNLGFGDYNIETDQIDDSINSNNGDHYRVFNTVLSTVPKFFKLHPNATMVVQGSDQGTAFLNKCKETCRKECGNSCKNINRRIKAYRYFVEKNYDKLMGNYTFFGGIKTEEGVLLHDNYEFGTEYDLVFCKINVNLQHEN